MTTDTLVLLAVLTLALVLLVVLLLRRPRVDLPPEWLARLQSLEQTTQSTQIAVAKNDGALDGMGQQLRGFTQTTQSTLETLRHAVDERLAQAVAESRNGRAELLAAFGVFEGRLDQRLAAFDAALTQRQAAQDAAVMAGLVTDYAKLSKSDATARKKLSELEKQNANVRDYLDQPLPPELVCMLDNSCTAAQASGAGGQGSAAEQPAGTVQKARPSGHSK